MNINEQDRKEIKGCMKLKEELEKTIGEDLSERIIEMEKVYVELVRKRDKEIERLNNMINKAIEYIENSDKYDFSKCELLDILKGNDKE